MNRRFYRRIFSWHNHLISGALSLLMMLQVHMAHADWPDVLNTPALKSNMVLDSNMLSLTKANDRIVAVGERGHIAYSDDNGFTWQQSDVPTIATLTTVFFVDAKYGWAAGHDGIVLHTEDGGKTWVKQLDGFIANEKVYEQAKINYARKQAELNRLEEVGTDQQIADAEIALENAMYAMDDAKFDFDDKSTKPFLSMWFKNRREGFVVGAYGMLFKTIDGGNNWNDWSFNAENPNRYHLNKIVEVGIDELLIVGEAGTILRSTNDGDQFVSEYAPYDGSFFGAVKLQNHQLAYGLRGTMMRYDTQTQTWSKISSASTLGLLGGVAISGSQAVLVGNGGSFIQVIESGERVSPKVRSGRVNTVAIVETPEGHYVLAGEAGIELVDERGMKLNKQPTLVQK